MWGGVLKIYNYYLSPDRELTRQLHSVLGFIPVHIRLFRRAFYHRSGSQESDTPLMNNERLEYLGDAVLGTIIAEYLFKKYPNADEGFLTKMRSKIVKRKTLNDIAEKMSLDILLNEYNNARLSSSMLGNAFEALVGALYIELGYQGCRKYIINKILRRYLDIHELEHFDDNYKSQLLEWCQKHGKEAAFQVVHRYKMDRRDRFRVAVLIDGDQKGTAEDFNKKSAEQYASEKALYALGVLQEEGSENG